MGLEPVDWDFNPLSFKLTWSQDLTKLKFLMSLHRNNSLRDKVLSSYFQRCTLYKQNAVPLKRGEQP